MTDREVMQQALEVLEFFWDIGYRNIAMKQKAAMDALRERLAQPEQEPVAWVYLEGLEALKSGRPWTAYGSNGYSRIPLYLNDAVAPKAEPRSRGSGAGFESLPASPTTEQEPVAWLVQYPNKHEFVWGEKPQWIVDAVGIEPLYTAPRQWQGLTEKEAMEAVRVFRQENEGGFLVDFARAIEAKLKERNA